MSHGALSPLPPTYDETLAECRKGVPDSLRPAVWYFLCTSEREQSPAKIEATYAAATKDIFGPTLPASIAAAPMFGKPTSSHVTLELVPALAVAHRRLSIVLRRLHGVDHCRVLPELMRLCLLVDISEAQVYCMMRSLLQRSRPKDEWKLPTSPAHELAVIGHLKDTVAWRYPLLATAMQRQGAWDDSYFADTIHSFLVPYVPLAVALRIVDAYLGEGPKIHCRFLMALLKLHKAPMAAEMTATGAAWWALLATRTRACSMAEICTVAYRKWYGYLFRRQNFELRLASTPTAYVDVSTIDEYGSPLPLVVDKSAPPMLLDATRDSILLTWLPATEQLKQLQRCYCAIQQGRGLDTLYRYCANIAPLIVVLQVLGCDRVIIAYLSHGVGPRDQLFGDKSCFVGSLAPAVKYAATGTRAKFVMCQPSLLAIGIDSKSSAAALEIDDGLVRGRSQATDVFGNPPLGGTEEFDVGDIEAYKFVL
ncbi:hypothetical protein SPRG_11998 [Saprolegnia parasitica CBS 223.65]|uniref:Oxidation resistance protein 1 n=1 Tax=Saprolegnia parasitica (strain CBS 223.65) TaxID=695850 RepID=A0A067C8J4_SAPPC|nr:hypothetical protein SPRG_11998 [Saprolegnia parasitica CBS 223.65]KDO22861.1 hypothetical protein SPRG_11998 [Saprolegnia parasitica CBS 223.65]|eukprot:XP_012206418.1 hypothetical protein SPRG_11998 [Saprolegnia parasitica CBS 223.65]